jgi:hypothetical protein
MQKEPIRVHRLAIPLIIKRRGTSLHISDGVFGHDFEFKDFGQIKVIGIDQDGFVTFEISMPEQQTLLEPQSRERLSTVGSFTLIGSSISKSAGSGISRGTYEYFKRSTDEFYYADHSIAGKKDKRIYLGSLQDQSSHISQILKSCYRFDATTWFDRKQLCQSLSLALSHGQKLKSALDILVLEGYLEKRESQKKGKPYELYRITSKQLQQK